MSDTPAFVTKEEIDHIRQAITEGCNHKGELVLDRLVSERDAETERADRYQAAFQEIEIRLIERDKQFIALKDELDLLRQGKT